MFDGLRRGRPGGKAQALAPLVCAIFALAALPAAAQQAESLHYNVNWPSGLDLGEASFTAQRTGAGWDLTASLDAAIPGFRISDRFHSVTSAQLCSVQFSREISQGSKKTSDETTFDYAGAVARRVSANGGGESAMQLSSSCAPDGLAFLFGLQQHLVRGGLPPAGQVFFGRAYSIRLEGSGQQNITVGGKPQAADEVTVHLTGPASNSTFEIYFARDAGRTPVLARIPTNLGVISVELSP